MVTIVIKALNEEKNIKRAIESAIKALKGLKDPELAGVDGSITEINEDFFKKHFTGTIASAVRVVNNSLLLLIS